MYSQRSLSELYRRLYRETDYGEKDPRARYFVDLVRMYIQKGSRILDVGCGRGILMRELLKEGYQVEGVEITGPLPEHENLVVHYLPVQSLNGLEPYDAVIASDTLEHIPPKELIPAIEKIVQLSGNYIFVSVPDKAAHNPLLDHPIRNIHLIVKKLDWWLDLFSGKVKILRTFRAARSNFIVGQK